jgi:Asp-tRNA(Asn)/Glu-tRNA(Gln) amidotransferase A subunit family amidase
MSAVTVTATAALAESDLIEMTLESAAAAFARGVTAVALTQAFLARIATYNPRYNAIITMNPAALDEARRR